MPKTLQDFENEMCWSGAVDLIRRELGLRRLNNTERQVLSDRIRELNNGSISFRNGRELIYEDGADTLSQDEIDAVMSGPSITGYVNRIRQFIETQGNNGLIPIPASEEELGRIFALETEASVIYVTVDDFNNYISNGYRPTGYVNNENINRIPDVNNPADALNVVQSFESTSVDVELSVGEPLYGWDGRHLGGGDRQPGLRDYMTSTLSQEDIEIMQRTFAGKEISAERASYMIDIMTELRNEGYNIAVKEPYGAVAGSNTQVSLSINGRDMEMRIYDEESPQYIGRVSNNAHNYYWQFANDMGPRGRELLKEFNPTVEDTMLLLNTVTGREQSSISQHRVSRQTQSAVEKYENGVSNVTNNASYTNYRFTDSTISKVSPVNNEEYTYNIMVTNRGNYYRNVAFTKEADADEFIRNQINIAKDGFEDIMIAEEMMAAAELVVRAEEMNDDMSYSRAEQREIRKLRDDAISAINAKMDVRYQDIQNDLFNDMVLLERYKQDPVRTTLDFKSLRDESIKQELMDRVKAVENGQSLEDVTMQDLYASFMSANFGSYEDGFNAAIVAELGNDATRPRIDKALEAALKLSHYDTDKLKGNDYAANRLRDRIVSFDADSARTLEDVLAADPDATQYQTKALLRVQEKLQGAGYDNTDIAIDNRGVIHYEYDRPNAFKKGSFERLSGEIGQVFNEDEYGIIQTQFASGENIGFVPGYEGYFIPGDGTLPYNMATNEADPEVIRDRVRVRGYEQALMRMIDKEMINQLQSPFLGGDVRNLVDDMGASSLNKLYRSELNGFKLPEDYVEKQLAMRSKEELQTVVKTLRNRVRFPNEYGDSAGTNYEMALESQGFNEAKLAGDNIRVIHDYWDNVFDPYMSGSGKNQGVERYLVDGAVVNVDGSIESSEGWVDPKTGELKRDRTAVTKVDEFSDIDHMPADRQMMATKQYLVANRVTDKVGVALMNFGGWTYDDSFVVSKEFAENNKVPVYMGHDGDGEGNVYIDTTSGETKYFKINGDGSIGDELEVLAGTPMRALQKQDKLSDFGSNKGVISLIVDRDMDIDSAIEQGLEKEVAFFDANPNLDVVGGPYALLSRNNMAVPRKLREDGMVDDLYDPVNERVIQGGLGYMSMMVTDMTADKKSHAYDRNDVAKGKGRSVSTLLLLNLQVLGADGIIEEVYGNNTKSWIDLREHMLAMGVDMDHDGKVSIGYNPQEGEERNHFKVESDKSAQDFLKEISQSGGVLNLPFPLVNKALNKELIQDKNEPRTRVNKDIAERAYTRDENGDFGIMIMSGNLRRSKEMTDGSSQVHDITDKYVQIYERAQEFNRQTELIKGLDADINNGLDGKALEDAKKERADAIAIRNKAYEMAQKSYEILQDTLAPKIDGPGPNGKHSLIRDKITSRKMPDSATLVASPDPRLNIDQISISQETADKMGLTEGGKVLGWRDPTWRPGAVRSFEIVIDNSVKGFAMAPLMDKSHDGDFDGDAYGFLVVKSEEALKDLETKLSHGANILNKGDGFVLGEDGEPMLHPRTGEPMYLLFVNDGMDVASSREYILANGGSDIEQLRYEALVMANDPEIDRKEVVEKLNDYMDVALRSNANFATDHIDLRSGQTVMTSLTRIVNHGAKGKPAAILECAKYEGVGVDGIELHDGYNGKEHKDDLELVKQIQEIVKVGGEFPVTPGTENPDKAWAGQKDKDDVQYASATKSDNTARPGSIMQKATAAFRNKGLEEVLEMFYKPTQMTLQIKHDAKEAKAINDQFDRTGSIRQLLVDGVDPRKDIFEKDRSINKDDFKVELGKAFGDLGLPYNPDHLNKLADALSDDNGKIRSLDKAFQEEASLFNKLSFGGVKNGGVSALMKGAIANEQLFQGENDIDRKVVPTAIREQNIVMAHDDVLVRDTTPIKDVDNGLMMIQANKAKDLKRETIVKSVEPEMTLINKGVKSLAERKAELEAQRSQVEKGADYGPSL